MCCDFVVFNLLYSLDYGVVCVAFFGLKAEFGGLEFKLGWAEITMGLRLVGLLVNEMT